MSPVVAVAGMHRSGTSMAAALLQSAGIDLGARLLAPMKGNAQGHFEDLDFVELHATMLDDLGESTAGWTVRSDLRPTGEHERLARALVAARDASAATAWGWKDPRTTLFLDFWAELIPRARFVLMYRSPWDVIDSLYRRGDFPFFWRPQLAVEIWIAYNRRVLAFARAHPARTFLAEARAVAGAPGRFVETVAPVFGAELRAPDDVVRSERLRGEPPAPHRLAALSSCFPQALELYRELERTSAFGAHDGIALAEPDAAQPLLGVFEDWMTMCRQAEQRARDGT